MVDDTERGTVIRLPRRLYDLLGFHVRMAHSAIHRDFMAAMEELELTQRQFAVLQIIAETPGVSQIDIANLLSMDRPTTMAIVNRLQDRGLLERRASTEDRRRQALHLTAEGEAFLARANEVITAHEKGLTEQFTATELRALVSLLQRLHGQ